VFLFVGEAGSQTCAHTDICPQLEFAHGLCGIKLLGVASHGATPRLIATHGAGSNTGGGDTEDTGGGAEADVMATRIPVHRALKKKEEALLLDR